MWGPGSVGVWSGLGCQKGVGCSRKSSSSRSTAAEFTETPDWAALTFAVTSFLTRFHWSVQSLTDGWSSFLIVDTRDECLWNGHLYFFFKTFQNCAWVFILPHYFYFRVNLMEEEEGFPNTVIHPASRIYLDCVQESLLFCDLIRSVHSSKCTRQLLFGVSLNYQITIWRAGSCSSGGFGRPPQCVAVYCKLMSWFSITNSRNWTSIINLKINWRSEGKVVGRDTHMKSTMPVLAMAKDKPRMPLPMMALLRLKTDIPKEVWPGCCSERRGRTSGREKVDCGQRFLYFIQSLSACENRLRSQSRKCRRATPVL